MHSLIQFYAQRTETIVALITALADFESPTHDKTYVDRLATHLNGLLDNLGAQVERLPLAPVGDMLLARWNTDRPGKPIVFLVHMDTVWPLGTLAARPVRVEGDRLIGPGTWDMKGSIALVLSVISGLRERGEFPDRPVWVLLTSDEETGSENSWTTIEKIAREAGLCLVMEFAGTNGGLKTWRKGLAHYTVEIAGRSSHAGNAPEKGINAVIEMAHQALHINTLGKPEAGTSVSVTVAHGGSATNVIPDSASLRVDVRFRSRAEADRIAEAMASLQPVLAGANVRAVPERQRPPMERDALMDRNFAQAQAIASRLGIDLKEEGSGGGSDGNITAALGVPTLDGLGLLGEGAHAVHEQVVISSIPERAALLDAMLREWVVD